MKDVGVPELATSPGAGHQPGNVLGAPRQDPHVEQRVAEVARDIAAEAERERPGQDQREEGVGRNARKLPAARAVTAGSLSSNTSSSNST